jgi:hypothetical protein
MAKKTGIERSKKNPIELGGKGGFLHIWPFNLFAHLSKCKIKIKILGINHRGHVITLNRN